MKTLAPRADNGCFGCGAANARGMKLAFVQDDERRRIVGRFRLGPEYQGGAGFVHGGIIATLLDEAMGKVNRFSQVRAVTAELRVEFRRPVPLEEEITVEAFEMRRDGRSLFHASEIRNAAGKLLASGTGRFVVVEPETYHSRIQESRSS